MSARYAPRSAPDTNAGQPGIPDSRAFVFTARILTLAAGGRSARSRRCCSQSRTRRVFGVQPREQTPLEHAGPKRRCSLINSIFPHPERGKVPSKTVATFISCTRLSILFFATLRCCTSNAEARVRLGGLQVWDEQLAFIPADPLLGRLGVLTAFARDCPPHRAVIFGFNGGRHAVQRTLPQKDVETLDLVNEHRDSATSCGDL